MLEAVLEQRLVVVAEALLVELLRGHDGNGSHPSYGSYDTLQC